MPKIATIVFNDSSLRKSPLPAEILAKIMNGLPYGSQIVGFREIPNFPVGPDDIYILVENDSFIDTPDGSLISSYPQIEVEFRQDNIGNISISGMSFEKAMGVKIPPPPKPADVLRCYFPVYKKYIGILESYNYCTSCGKKEGEH